MMAPTIMEDDAVINTLSINTLPVEIDNPASRPMQKKNYCQTWKNSVVNSEAPLWLQFIFFKKKINVQLKK